MSESRSIWVRFWAHFSWLDRIDVLLYGGLGLALLVFAIYSVASALIQAGQLLGLAGFLSLLVVSLIQLVRDLRRPHLSLISKGLLGAWAICTLFIVVLELWVSFS